MNNIPCYLERTAGGTAQLSMESILLERRVIFLDQQINSDTVNTLIKQILLLASTGKERITLVISSPGGDIQAGLALLDTIQACPCTVVTVSLGLCASMAAILLAAGTKGRRHISKHSRVMIHEPLIANSLGGSCSSVQAAAAALAERKGLLDKLLADFTGNPLEVVQRATGYDNYMNATEAVNFGICDAVLSDKELFDVLKGAV